MSALLYYTLGRMLSKIEQSLNLGKKNDVSLEKVHMPLVKGDI